MSLANTPAALALAMALAGCQARAPASPASPAASAAYAGWYAGGHFQPCGEPAMPLTGHAELERMIRAQGMSPDDPVYVRVEARLADGRLALAKVLQVGSPLPVRDCPMTGTRTP